MLGLSPLILLIAGVVFAAWSGGLYLKGRTAGKEAREPEVQQLRLEKGTAEAANAGLQRDVNQTREVLARCSAEVGRLETIGKDAKAAVARAISASAERARSFEDRIVALSREAAATSSLSPEMQCDAARKTLGELADVLREVDCGPCKDGNARRAAGRATQTTREAAAASDQGEAMKLIASLLLVLCLLCVPFILAVVLGIISMMLGITNPTSVLVLALAALVIVLWRQIYDAL
jgi:hypothetical protein